MSMTIDLNNPCIINPTGEFGPKSYIDYWALSPANYPRFKSPKGKPKNQDVDIKKKKPVLKVDFTKIGKEPQGMTQTTLDQWLFKPKTALHVHFKERSLLALRVEELYS